MRKVDLVTVAPLVNLLDAAIAPCGLLTLDAASRRLQAAAEALGATSIPIGRSREGRPLNLVRVGAGPRRSFWYAGAHANEALGVSTIVTLAEALAAAPAALEGPVGFDLVLCLDPDGHVRNERWFGPRIELLDYYRHFYRGAVAQTPDWDLPVEYASSGGSLSRPSGLPEAKALAAALTLSRPRTMVGLHNAEVGGAHYPVLGSASDAWSALAELTRATGIPLDDRMLDDPGADPLVEGVFPFPSLVPAYEAVLASGHPDPGSLLPMGESAAQWSTRFGTVTLVTEIPYWTPTSPTPAVPLAEVAHRAAAEIGPQVDLFGAIVDECRDLLEQSAHGRAVLEAPVVLAKVAAGLEAIAKASNPSQVASSQDVARLDLMLARCVPQRYLGMALTALDMPTSAPSKAPRWLPTVRERFDLGLGAITSVPMTAHPIEALVSLQCRAGLLLSATEPTPVP